MGRYLALLIALMLGSWIAFNDQLLPESQPIGAPAGEFAAERAFADVTLIAARAHPIGSAENARVRDALVARMAELGLSPQVRAGVGVQSAKWATDRLVAGPVENIVGVLPGRDRNAPAVALMAHYDSVPGSPGAADDAIGVATALETVRAIKARGTPTRDVMVILTDGEEAGLLGANHFFRRDPLARRIGLVINAEARGSTGRVNMFQTSPRNGELIDLFARTAQDPSSSSLSVLLYEKMPNDTDLTETLKSGIAGLNYAIIGRQFDYHSPTSTPANLERGSLQDMGTQVLAATAEAAFAAQLPGRSPNVVYSNLFGNTVVAYPVWFGWVIVLACAVLLAFAVRWARHSGEFPASDILRGMGALAFAGVGTVAVLEFARRLTGAGFGFVEQRFLLAQSAPWEWAIMMLSLGFLMLSAGDMARGRRWMAAVPLVLGLAASAFGEVDWIGIVPGVIAAALGTFVYNRPASRKGAWAGALVLGLILTVALQAFAPGAAYVIAWPLLVACIGAAATALSARRGILPISLLTVLAAAALGWQGGISHFAYEGMDLMPLFSVQMITAGLVLWPLAQPDTGAQKGLVIGGVLLACGLALTLIIRAEDPWTPRYPQVSYVGYHVDQDTGRAWRFSPPVMSNGWTDKVLRAEGGPVERLSHWAWRRPMFAASAPPVAEPAPTITLERTADGGARLLALPPPGARTLEVRVRAASGGEVGAVGGVPVKLALPKGEWVRINWQAPGSGLAVDLRPSGPGRLDVRYVAVFERWPTGVAPLPQRPADLMPWDNSDSTFVSGTRAFAW
ncbi:M20/M25/M40 family metallo-hydrolase [Phenylobacterium sp.]|uniref:M20/M25/M40 family metallo-hydrolase n=1 Tax=Phenylobacterium sp. TaxID=1871053 RepID=UPI0025D5E644|nr:M20/M25/M40 family metallo-hydrolase [Phenylobacterium sp.]